jgi:hypothetical protein
MGKIKKAYTLLLLIIILITSWLVICPAKAEVENISTTCGIFVDSIIEGQPVTITIQVYPAPPEGQVFNNLIVGLTSPMQGVWGNGGNGPWSKSNISTDSNGRATVTFGIVSFSGYWNVDLYFGGQYFDNKSVYYQPINSQRGFTISPAQSPKPTQISTLGPAQIRSVGDDGTNVKIITIQNQSSISNPIQLLFCVKALVLPYSFGNIGYNLDGGAIYNVSNFVNETRIRQEGDDVTVWAEVALPKLSEGAHSVTVYYGYQFSGINQRYEVFAYSSVNFLVSSKSPTPVLSPTPYIPEFSSIIILILLITVTLPTLLVYFKRHKRQA